MAAKTPQKNDETTNSDILDDMAIVKDELRRLNSTLHNALISKSSGVETYKGYVDNHLADNTKESKETMEHNFRRLMVVISDWYDTNELINMLKVLYGDLLNVGEMKASSTRVLMDRLIATGDLQSTDLKLLYDTIKVTEQCGLQWKLKDAFPSFPNAKDVRITTITPYRQKLIKLGMNLTSDDVRRISDLYNTPAKEYEDSWTFIMDLERRKLICDGNMDTLISNVQFLKLQLAVDALKGSTIKVILNCKQYTSDNEDESDGKFVFVKLLTDLEKVPKWCDISTRIVNFYKRAGFDVDAVRKGSIVFHLSTHDPNALTELQEMSLNGKLINDLADILVEKNQKKIFLKEWTTHIGDIEYEAALSELLENDIWQDETKQYSREHQMVFNQSQVTDTSMKWCKPADDVDTLLSTNQSKCHQCTEDNLKLSYHAEHTVSENGDSKRAKQITPKHDTHLIHVIEHLKLQNYYPKKITREKALEVSESFISSDDLTDACKIPWFILQNLVLCNYKGRCFDVCQKLSYSEKGMGSFSLLQGLTDEIDVDDDKEQVSPIDALLALILCCDDFLKQLLVEKMYTCQIAFPLLIPIFNTVPHKCEMLLWAMSTLRNQWKPSEGPSCERSLVVHPLPIVSALRLGRPRISKSKILNHVMIDDLKHDIFFHYECKGGTLERKLCKGVLELAWYLPAGDKPVFPKALSFINLRGNAAHFKTQTAFLSEISMATIAFTSSDNFQEEDSVLLESLYKQMGHLILVVDGSPGKQLRTSIRSIEQRCPKQNNKCLTLIMSTTKNDQQLGMEIRGNLIQQGPSMVPDRSIEVCADIARRMHIQVDEDTPERLQARVHANNMFGHLQPIKRMTQLPLQMIAIEIGEKKKKQRRMDSKGNTSISMYVDQMETDITKLRNQQKHKCNNVSDICKDFQKSYMFPVITRKYFYNYVKILTDRHSLTTLQPLRHEYFRKWNTLCEIQRKKDGKSYNLEAMKKELDDLESRISQMALGLEHFSREFGQIYEMRSHFKLLDDPTSLFPNVAAEMLLHGHPLELMDGDATHVPITWIKAVMTSLKEMVGDKRIFVLSVLGIQSSGKSTMLNAMFGLQFAVSAGRCTKGAFAQIVKVDTYLQKATNCDYVLVVDTEGLRAPELASMEHSNRDNELATLVIGLGDTTIINIMGENPTDMQDTLQIAVLAFMNMEKVNINPSCIFVHQNVSNVAALEINAPQKRKLTALLDEITRNAADQDGCMDKYKTFSDVIQFQENTNVMYVSSLWQGDPPMAPPNPSYSQCIIKLKKQVIEFMRNSHGKTIDEFNSRLSDLWTAILSLNFVFGFRNTVEIRAYNALETEVVNQSRIIRRNKMKYSDLLEEESKTFTAMMIQKEGNIILRKYTSQFNQDVKFFRTQMGEYFTKETKACRWKATTEIKIDELCGNLRRELTGEFVSIRTKIIGRAKIDENIKGHEQEILGKAKSLAKMFRNAKLSEAKLKTKFDEEWAKWISVIEPTSSVSIDEYSLECVFQESFAAYHQDTIHDMFINKSIYSPTFVHDNDLESVSLVKMVKMAFSVSTLTCLDHANSLATSIKSDVLAEISNRSRDCKSYSKTFGMELMGLIKNQLKKKDSGVRFSKRGVVRVSVRILWSIKPELNKLEQKYRRETDPQMYMETQKERLWHLFRDECTMVDTAVKAASVVSRELERAITSHLPSQCKKGVIDHMNTSSIQAFANKMSFHAQMLIDIAEQKTFSSYREYLANPFECMKTYIKKYIETVCMSVTTEGHTILQNIYCQKLHNICVKVEKAIDDTCKNYTDKTEFRYWWPGLFRNIGNDLVVNRELGLFEDGKFDVFYLKDKLLNELEKSRDNLKNAFNANTILYFILGPCQQFFTDDFLGCPCLCPFCKAPCDLQAAVGDADHDHRTEYHRPEGVTGYHVISTKVLSIDICTESVLSQTAAFRNKDTEMKSHLYKDYQGVNAYYKSWKIQPMEGESQLYWKWFIATYNEELAKYYEVEKAVIPDGWMNISWESAKEDMIRTYNL